MAKVKKPFFCIQEQKTYFVNDDYNGKRKDLDAYLVKAKRVKK